MSLGALFEEEMSGFHPHLSTSEVVYAINISLRYKYIFVETPKCACTAIKLALQRLELGDPKLERAEFEDIHDRESSPLLSARQVGSFRALLGNPEMFKFCFVRHPCTRLLSCYLDKIQRDQPQKMQILRQLGLAETELNVPISFDQFVRAVASQPISLMNPHWRVQYYQTMQTGIEYDFIGRFERFEDGIRVLEDRIAPELWSYLRPEFRNATDASAKLAEYMTEELLEIVYRKFRVDFDHFGYDRPF